MEGHPELLAEEQINPGPGAVAQPPACAVLRAQIFRPRLTYFSSLPYSLKSLPEWPLLTETSKARVRDGMGKVEHVVVRV